MTLFPANRQATQPNATVFEDAACRSLAAIKIDGVPVPGSILVATNAGLWPAFTAVQSVLYYRTPGGIVTVFTPADTIDETVPVTVEGNIATGEAVPSLIAALAALGLPVVDDTVDEPPLDLVTARPIQGVALDSQALIDLIAALGEIGLPVSYVAP